MVCVDEIERENGLGSKFRNDYYLYYLALPNGYPLVQEKKNATKLGA